MADPCKFVFNRSHSLFWFVFVFELIISLGASWTVGVDIRMKVDCIQVFRKGAMRNDVEIASYRKFPKLQEGQVWGRWPQASLAPGVVE